MQLRDVMTRDVRTIGADEPADRAWDAMRGHRVRHLVVTSRAGVVGVLSERDLGGRRGDGARAGRLVSDLMNPHVVTARPDTTIRQAANLLRGRSVGCLPVFEGPRLVGIVTVTDMLELLGRGTERALDTEGSGRRKDWAGRARTFRNRPVRLA